MSEPCALSPESTDEPPTTGPRVLPHPGSENLADLARQLQIHRALLPLRPTTVLVPAGGEGRLAAWIRHLTGAEVLSADASVERCRLARERYGVPSLAARPGYLPFPDGFFDVVVCDRSFDTADDPFTALREAGRLAKRALLLTSNAVAPGESLREAKLRLRDAASFEPGAVRNCWMPSDFTAMLGPAATLRPLHLFFLARDPGDQSPEGKLELLRRVAAVPERPSRHGVGLLGLWSRSPVEPMLPLEDPRCERLLEALRHPDPIALLRRDLGPEPFYLLTELERQDGVPSFLSDYRPPHPPLPGEARLRPLLAESNVAEEPAERRRLEKRLEREAARLFLAAVDPPLEKWRWVRRRWHDSGR